MAKMQNGLRCFMTDLAPYKLPLLGYEGGQTFTNGPTDALNNLYMAANRDQRMSQAYARMHGIFSNGKLVVGSSSCTTIMSEWRANTALGAPLERSCKRLPRSVALHRSGKPSKILYQEILVGGRVVPERSVRYMRHAPAGPSGFNDRSISYSPGYINNRPVQEAPASDRMLLIFDRESPSSLKLRSHRTLLPSNYLDMCCQIMCDKCLEPIARRAWRQFAVQLARHWPR
jgi:hypothetical protein